MSDDNKKKILLVEDEAIIAITEKMNLEKYGYDVVTVNSGEKAVKFFKSTPDINLILMDIDLGDGIDGTEAAASILKEHNLPVLFVSSHTEPSVVEKTEIITSYGYVVKSSSITVLDASIKMAFKLFEANVNEKKKEEFLREAYLFNEQIIHNCQEGIIVYDTDLRYRVWNTFMEKLSGINSDKVLGKHPFDVFPFLKETGVVERLEKALKGEEVVSVDFPFDVPETGESGWCTDQSSTLRNVKGEIIGVIGMVRDITKRKQTEDELREKEELFRTLTNLAPVGIYLTDPEGNCQYANHAWCSMSGLSLDEALGNGWINGLHPDDREMVFSNWSKMVESQGQWGHEYRFCNREGKVTWVYGLAACQKDPDGKVIKYVGVNLDITEHKQAEMELQENYNLITNMLNGISDAYFSMDDNLVVNYYNTASEKLLGKKAEDVIGKYLFDVFPEAKGSIFNEKYNQAVKEKIFLSFETFFEIPPFANWYDVRVYPLPEGISVFFQVTTERKLAEKALLLSEERYRSIIESSPMGIHQYELKKDGRLIFIGGNPEADKILGVDNSVFIGKTIEEAFPPLADTEVPAKYKDVVKTGIQWQTEQIDYKDDEIKGAFYVTAFRTSENKMAAFFLDITKRIQTEDELKKIQQLLSESEEIGKVGGWEFNIDTLKVKWTKETFRIHEVDFDFDPNVNKGINFYTPDSKPLIEKAVQRAIEFEEPFELELEIITAKGNRRSVHTIGKTDLANRRVFGFFQDVTERKLAEKKIRLQLVEKETLLREVHHRIKNNISSIENLLSFQLESSINPEIVNALQDAIGRVSSMRVLYDKLLISDDYEDVSAKNYIESLIEAVIYLFPDNNKIEIKYQLDDFKVESKKLFPLGLIINELLTNVMKYAFNGKKNCQINISLKHAVNEVVLTIQDNGIGVPENFTIADSTGFGLMLVGMLSEQLGGIFTIENYNGTRSILKFNI